MILLTDQQLISNYINGDEFALEIIIKRHQKTIFNFINKKILNEELANDFFQDTFIKAILILKSGKYQEEGKFIQWILRIANNLVIDYFRSSKKYKMVSEIITDDSEISIFDLIGQTEDSFEDELIKNQQKIELIQIVETLPSEQKEMIKLRIFNDYSFKDIAEELDISINTCLGRMRYALINLRKKLKKENIYMEI
jgi:RNA polymerase sigma-70 factor (ECF subfamily)